MIGPHQSIIWRFTGTGHGAAACMATCRLDRSYCVRSSSGRRSMRTNMVGTNWAMRHPVALDQLEAQAGVELLHHHDRGAEPVHRHRVDERGGVVQRCGGEVDRARTDAVHGHDLRDLDGGRRGITERRARQRLAHALRPSGGPRRVEHLPALLLVVERAGFRARPAPRRTARTPRGRRPPTPGPRRAPGRGRRSRPPSPADDTSATAPQSSSTYCTSATRRWLLTAVKWRPERCAAQRTSRNGPLFSMSTATWSPAHDARAPAAPARTGSSAPRARRRSSSRPSSP